MAYTTKKTFSTGAVLTAADMNTYVSDNVEYIYDFIKVWDGGVPAARVSGSTGWSQTLTASATEAIIFDQEILDTDAIWDVGAPTRLTCKTTGVYLLTGNVIAAQQQIYYIKIEGETVAKFESATTGKPAIITTVYPMTVNQYAELFVQNSASSSQAITRETGVSPVFSMVYMGPSA